MTEPMKTFQEYIDQDMMNWLQKNNLKYKVANIQLDKGSLCLFFNDKLCLKVYDRLGHGYSLSINIADQYDESIYENDNFNLSWAFKYFKISQISNFSSRSEEQYLMNLPKVIEDIKNIIPYLNGLESAELIEMKEWINIEARKGK
jgi:hypothetical protein